MKVILLQNVAKLGKKYEIKNVADGHALNMLIPRGLVQVATSDSLKKMEAKKNKEEAVRKAQEDSLAKTLKTIDGKKFMLKMKLNEKGHLFAAMHAEDVAAVVKEKSGVDLPAAYFNLEKPIKEGGDHAIKIAIGGVSATVNIKIGEAKED